MKKIFSILNFIAKVRAEAARRTSATLSAQIIEFEAREKHLLTESAKYGTIGDLLITKYNKGFRERTMEARANLKEKASIAADKKLDCEMKKREIDSILWKQEKRIEALKLIKVSVARNGLNREEIE
jgi:hypothetical protein